MQNMSRDELVALLDDIRDRVASGDSLEGNIQYLLSTDEQAEHPYDVTATYRVGNLLGQGGTCLIGIRSQDEPQAGAA